MTDTVVIALNAAGITTVDNEVTVAPATVRKAHVYVDPSLLAFLGILVSLLIPGLIFGKTETPFLILFLAILIPWLWYVVKLIFGVKVKLRFEDNILIEEQAGVEAHIPLSDISHFNFISSAFGGDYIRLKFKTASGTFRYTPVSASGKDVDPFMDIVDDLAFAVNEINLSKTLDGAENMDNPALIEQALQSAPQISTRPSFGWRLWRLYQIILVIIFGGAYIVYAIELDRVGDWEGYVLTVTIVGTALWIIWPKNVWPRKKRTE